MPVPVTVIAELEARPEFGAQLHQSLDEPRGWFARSTVRRYHLA